ncbi:MAG: phosphotransferase family protein [Acidimicrobiales bacterium]|nr:phosphotransferase family protein [Acidimicrobiales bacterium]
MSSTTEAASVRPGNDLDWPTIESYLRSRIPGLEGDFKVLQFTNGAANLTYLLTFGDLELVLRRPPFGTIAPGAHDMRREYRVLSKLGEVFEPAPKALLFCDDHSIAGSDFFVMEYRSGVTVRDRVPPELLGYPDLGKCVGEAFVTAVAHLHALDPAACGLSDLGRPEGFIERQVAGWTKRWELARPEDGSPLMDELGERFAGSMPAPQRTSILHNDLHLGNCQFDPSDPSRVKSLFDWDMATLGDPLVDFGSLLAYWRDDQDLPIAGSSKANPDLQLPSRSDATNLYAELTGLDLSRADWYHAFGRWRIAIIMQQIHNRWAQGDSADPRGASFGANVPILAETAHSLLGRESPSSPQARSSSGGQ